VGVAVNKPTGKMQGKGGEGEVLQKLINMSHVWKVCLMLTTRKEGKLGKKQNNCTSLPFTTVFHTS